MKNEIKKTATDEELEQTTGGTRVPDCVDSRPHDNLQDTSEPVPGWNPDPEKDVAQFNMDR